MKESQALKEVKRRLAQEETPPTPLSANPGHIIVPSINPEFAGELGRAAQHGDYFFDDTIITNLAKLKPYEQKAALRLIGDTEYERCKTDPLYWISEHMHPAMPYVYTWDKRPLYACKLCQTTDRHDWTFPEDAFPVHLYNMHGMEPATPAEIRSYFNILPTIRSFPNKPYTLPLMALLTGPRRYVAIEKSRDVMGTWMCIAAASHMMIFNDGVEIVVQSEKANKTYELIQRGLHIWRNQPKFLKRHKLTAAKGSEKSGHLDCEDLGNVLYGIAQGPNQIRQYHPALVWMDEAAFQPNAHEAFAAIQPAIQGGGKIWLLSSAYPSWFQTVIEDRDS